MVRSVEKYIDKENYEIVETKESEGIFESIFYADIAEAHLRRLLIDAKNEMKLMLSTMGIGYITRKTEVYNILLEKAKRTTSIRILLPYEKANEPFVSRLIQDSNHEIKVQYLRNWDNSNQLLLLVDDKLVLN